MQQPTRVSQRTAATSSGEPATILVFAGDISSASKDPLLNAYYSLNETRKILLDFTAVDYINSSGIAIIIQMLLESRKTAESRTIGIFGLSTHFQKVFTMVGINKYAMLHKSEADALAAI